MFDPSELEAFSALLHCVYDGATNPQAWPSIVRRVTEWVQGDKGALFTLLHRAGNGGFVFAHNIGAENIELWDTRFNTPDPLTARGIELGQVYQGSVILSHQLLPMAELHQTTFYKDFLVPMNIEYQLINIIYGTERQPLMPMAYVAFNSRASGAFTEDQRGKMQLLLPHISRAMGVLMTLRAAELRSAITLSAFDRLKTGALLLDPTGLVAYANPTAQTLLARGDGLKLRQGRGDLARLEADDADAQAALHKAINQALQPAAAAVPHFANGLAVPRPSGAQPYVLQFSTLGEAFQLSPGMNVPRAVIFISDADAPMRLDPAIMSRAYGLTPAEVRAAEALSGGGSIETVAARLGISANTLKTQLQAVYQKIGVNDRAALTKTLAALAR